jgi:predicted small metal-binding protein
MGGDQNKVVECSCGTVMTAATEDGIVAKVQEHAKTVHDLDMSRDQVLSMARPA